MKNYFTFNEVSNGAYLVVNDFKNFVDRSHKNFNKIKDIAVKYNNEKVKTVRNNLLNELKDLLNSKELETIQNSKEFLIDTSGNLYHKDIPSVPIPSNLSKYIKKAIEDNINLTGYINFWKNLYLNPDKTVISQLFGFLENNGHPITTNGYFLAYKKVNVKPIYDENTGKQIKEVKYDTETGNPIPEKYTQGLTYTATTNAGPYGQTIKIGEAVKMPRNECDSDPNVTCSKGLHVGSMQYVKTFSGSVVLEVLINPRNVVAVPIDYNNTKMRVCEYYPFAISNGENESIYLESDYIDYDKKAQKEELAQLEKETAEKIKQVEEESKLKKGL